METIHLFDSYYFREATAEEFGPFFQEKRPVVFSDSIIPLENWMSEEDKQKQKELFSLVRSRYALRIFVMKGDEIVGWHVGRQGDEDMYYMSNTGIFKEYQGKGIYTALLPKLLQLLKEKGFQKVMSHHHASNNSILVPKLKAGFQITGFEIDERFGIFVRLAYIFNQQRLNLYKYRTGAIRPDEEIRKYL